MNGGQEDYPVEEGRVAASGGEPSGRGAAATGDSVPLQEEYPNFLLQNDEIDRMIEERAGAFNLTGTNIRNILYHVVLGVGNASDIWEADEPDLMSLIELAEPKTRAAKQKLMLQSEAGPSSHTRDSDPLLTLPEVRSPDEEDEEDDQDYIPQPDTECSEDSEEDIEGSINVTPKSDKHRKSKVSECESTPATPSMGLAKRTRSLFSLKDRDLLELEQALPEDEVEEKDDEERTTSTAVVAEDTSNTAIGEEDREEETSRDEENWMDLEKELGEEFDNVTEEEEESSDDGCNHAADEGTFTRFLAGITNPQVEFAEDDTNQDEPYMYRENQRFELEEFRTDKDVTVTKKEMAELYKDLDRSHPDVKEQLGLRRRKKNLSDAEEAVIVEDGPLFDASSLVALREQLQMHLQLLVQHAVLANNIPSLDENKSAAIRRIEELEDLYSQTSTAGLLQAMEGSEARQPVMKCIDVYTALRLVRGERGDEPDVTPLHQIPTSVCKELIRTFKDLSPLPVDKYQFFNFNPFFHKFLHIRPTVNFICRTKIRPHANKQFTELEDNLLAHGLDAFGHVKDQTRVYELIHEFYLPIRTPKQICIRVKNRLNKSAPYNVIKHYKQTSQIKYDTDYTSRVLTKRLAVPLTPSETPSVTTSTIKRDNLDWLVSLREHRLKLRREYKKRKQRLNCTKQAVLTATKLSTTDESHSFEVAFLLKAKEVLKDDTTTYFNVFKILAEYNKIGEFDCQELIGKIAEALKDYPDLGFEFMSIFSPLPDMPVDKLLETLSHVKTRILLRELERHFKNNPSQFKKILKLVMGANINKPDETRDNLLAMLRGKPDLCDMVSEYFDKCALKPKANDFEYIDLTDKNPSASDPVNYDGFEEMTLLDRTSASAQRHQKLIDSINKHHDDQRKLAEEEKQRRKLERKKIPARNIVECGDTVLTWTRDQDREILRMCRTSGAKYKTFKTLSKAFADKTVSQVKDRFSTLMELMEKSQKAAAQRKSQSGKKRIKTPLKSGMDTAKSGVTPANSQDPKQPHFKLPAYGITDIVKETPATPCNSSDAGNLAAAVFSGDSITERTVSGELGSSKGKQSVKRKEEKKEQGAKRARTVVQDSDP